MDIITVRDMDGLYEEVLHDFDYASFSYSYEKNASRQITFNIAKTPFNEFSYELTQVESIITYLGQQYVVKKCDPTVSAAGEVKAVTAHHIMYLFQDWCQYAINEGERTYSIDQVLNFAFSGNRSGFSYKVQGSFQKVTIENLGDKNGIELVNLITEKFGAICFADNKVITFYDEASFYKDSNKIFRYLYNTDEIKVTTSTETLKTVIKCYGKAKDNADSYSGDAKYTAVVTYESPNTKVYGKRYANSKKDERFTNVNSLTNYAKEQILDVPETTLALRISSAEEVSERDSWHFIHETLNYDTVVKVVSLKKGYCLANTKPEVTFSNRKKDMVQIQRAIANSVKTAREKAESVSNTALSAQRMASQAYDGRIISEVVGEVEE
ncbi:hypothetical protein JH67_03060 [Listeria monocytogenes]|nr:hypothetical protein [Listeria monocytogenes]